MIATRFITHNVFGFLAILLISHLPLSPFLGVLLVSIIWMVSAAFFTMDYKETKQIKGIVLAVNAGINLTHERRYNFDPPVRLVSNRFRFLVFL